MIFHINFRTDGLATRLLQTANITYYRKAGIQTKAFWKLNNECSVHFLDLLKNVCEVDFQDGPIQGINALNSASNLPRSPHPRRRVELLKDILIPSEEIKDIILSLKEKYDIGPDVVGIHLRCTEGYDWRNQVGEERHGRSEALINNLNKIEELKGELKGKRVMLVADNEALINFLLNKYENFFRIEEDILPNHDGTDSNRPHTFRSQDSVKMALALAYLLSTTDYQDTLRLSLKSYFSRLPLWLRGIEF
jgi:hypothetical protein